MGIIDVFTTQQAADTIGVTDAYVRHLIARGEIKAKKLGKRIWVISDAEVHRFKIRQRKGGRPRISD